MTYSINNPCWKCAMAKGNGGPCTDSEKLQEGVNTMYADGDTHKGAGNILLSCWNMEQQNFSK